MRIAAIDPGPTQSALVVCETSTVVESRVCDQPKIEQARFVANGELLIEIRDILVKTCRRVLIERIAPFNKRLGWELVYTIEWLSKFELVAGDKAQLVLRKDVAKALCGNPSGVNDTGICDEIRHRYGGRERAVGTKKSQGPLYILKKDLWQAFALVIAWPDLKQDERTD